MKILGPALVVVTAAASLTACYEPVPSPEEEQDYVNDQASLATRSQLATDEKELKKALADIQKTDPSVKDVYYGVDAQGHREIHVVRENAESQSGVSDMVWPLLGGMAAGAFIGNMMNSGGVSKFAAHQPPASYSQYDEQERRKRRNGASSAYTTVLMNTSRRNIVSSPSYRTSMRASVISARSTGSFKGASSARGGSYGFGG
ncbi:hypothetical protein ACI2KR_09280 [Pseudomonas luteola]